ERCLEKAVRILPRKAEALSEAGRRCQQFGQYDLATHYFERAVREKDSGAEALVTLAELYERGPRAREAPALVERALGIRADHPLALLAQARLKRLAGEIEAAEQHVRSLLERVSC